MKVHLWCYCCSHSRKNHLGRNLSPPGVKIIQQRQEHVDCPPANHTECIPSPKPFKFFFSGNTVEEQPDVLLISRWIHYAVNPLCYSSISIIPLKPNKCYNFPYCFFRILFFSSKKRKFREPIRWDLYFHSLTNPETSNMVLYSRTVWLWSAKDKQKKLQYATFWKSIALCVACHQFSGDTMW